MAGRAVLGAPQPGIETMKTQKSKILPLVLALATLGSGIQPASAASFVFTGSMHDARCFHTATLLPGGQVLVAGGDAGLSYYLRTNPISSAELYDPAAGTWTMTGGSMETVRESHTATLLPNGKVLVVGGEQGQEVYLSSAELFDPATGAWTKTGSLNTARSGHTATLLANGKVLVAGGAGVIGKNYEGRLTSAELYDPNSGTWTLTGSMNTGREWHTATLLPDGKVLVAGGFGYGVFLSSAELYDTTTGTWEETGSLNTARDRHTATLLPNGKVLVAGGSDISGSVSSAELYDPATGTWTETGALNEPRSGVTATLLPNGKVLVAAGASPSISAELYDPAIGTWTLTAAPGERRIAHTATLLPSGKVLLAGGYGSGVVLSSALLYHPDSDGGTPSLKLLYDGNHTMGFYWNGVGTLQQADSLTAPNWEPAPIQDNPHTISTTGPMEFYRVNAN